MDQRRYFSIGEVSKLKNVTIKALRYYHTIGLLSPVYVNPDNGYRYYTMGQFIYIDIIKLCQQSNVTIKEIKVLFEKADTNELKLFLEKKSKEIEEEMVSLEQLQKRISLLQRTIHSSEVERKKDGIHVQTFKERYLLRSPTQAGELNEVLSFDQLDEQLAEFTNHTFEYGLIYTFLHDDLNVRDVFRIINVEDYQLLKETATVSVLPSGQYVTVNCTKESEEEVLQLLVDYLKTNDLEYHDLYMLYLVTDVFNQDNYHAQFQVNVKPTP
ncbi:MerR family DNA-binding transcriptional regulator [Geomicrobium sediminis]|uniref:DNA-binding transcriptional MerR regulator n=1 Tax=Geomicrobium sediminis TaxID=1347788 RepID=A0ABS2PAI6_9BACL|nr:MerR family DNA-binding transcriptional regulator [Geomicrobium sediminis]MBM7632400.1 DNA-binding transcriptional MerR regulator [Geomicrobium sediminis]